MNQHARVDPLRSRSSTWRRSAAGLAAPSTRRSRACSTIASSSWGRRCGVRGRARGVLRREACDVLRERHRCAACLSLMAKGIGPGDAVFCPSFTFCATAEVVALVGATPVFVDVRCRHLQHRCREPEARDCDRADARACKPKAVIPVDLFGLPADHDAHRRGRRRRRPVRARRRRAGLRRHLQGPAARHASGTRPRRASFPAKPLGCYGDGGAVLTDDDELAERS